MKPLPSKDEIRQWISENPGLSAKRDIAKAFGIKGDGRIELKRLLRELEGEGVVEKTSAGSMRRGCCRRWRCCRCCRRMRRAIFTRSRWKKGWMTARAS
jgi:hypothetical protein